ncbi:helicase-exonuclease AddAB subunit AddB [Lachnoclostridium sp. An169]|uniref:PD-(D/E)XK nuclease family protein n=1 Tax=Lachnoclostridium sp. An169 TaxID=1965569 RepID=UPI000B36F6FD|nr:PD-(D/E)XK nuclease family protein [Lachnoclostridium sp. An169]OUP83464.1 helicase-exonuclease AddAB subunit AddB [Lachnoclostridium sp. An169]
MSLQFIFGNSGSGKSHYLIQHIVQESVRCPQKNYLVLVPEQFTMETQRELCRAHPRRGIMNIDVLSFGRLAHRVFEEQGQDHLRVLDDEGKNLVLRRIAGGYEEELTVLKGNLKKQGYISEVKSVISEFTQYGVGFERLDEFMEGIDPDSYLYYKLKDIRKVYEGFEEFLKERYITKEEMLDVLSGMVPRSKLLKGSVVALDGFTGFTPVQNRLLGELLRVCEKVMITVEMDRREDPFVYRHPYQLFGLSKQMVTSLVKTAQEVNTEIDDPAELCQTPPWRFRENPVMAFLESELFRYSRRTWEEEQSAVSLHESRNPRSEAMHTAEQIRRLVREKGFRYRDIAVITSDMNVYADVLEKACAAYEIPVFMDYKKSILLNSFVEYLRSLLSMAEEGFTYESVFRHLRTGLTGFTADEVDRMENYVVALGLKGYKKWQQAWVRRTPGTDGEALADLNHLRVRFVEKIDPLMIILKKRRKTVRDITLAVYEHLVREKLQEQLKSMEDRFQAEGELALAKEYSQVYRIAMELFDRFVELLGDEETALKDYCGLLDAGLEEAKVGVIPPSIDQVVIGDMERTRIRNIRALFFVGANDTLLPGNAGARGLLSERDREKFADARIELSPGPKEKLYAQKFYLYMNLTKPTEYLCLSWSKVSGEGKTLRPAYLIQDIRRLFPDIRTRDEENRELAYRELTRKTGIRYLAEGIRDRRQGVGQEWKELYTWFAGDEKSRTALSQVLRAGFLRRQEKSLGKETAGELYSDPDYVSVTRLEQFASCAYAHFLNYGLRLSDREEYGFETMDLGNIVHQALERFARKAEREKLNWTEMTDEKRDELIEESVEESVIDYGNTVLFSSARNEYMIHRIKRLIRRSVWALTKQLEKGDFVPSGYELKFGSGKIDRIDTCEDESKVYVKVTDYKTGMKAFDITAFYHGLQMQLPVYMNAAVEVEKKRHPGKQVVPAGIFYYRIQDPIVGREDTDEAVEKSILKELRLDGIINGSGEIVEHLEHDLSGTSVLYPLGRNRDGSLSKSSRALPPEAFDTVLAYTKEKERELKEQMYAGDVQAAPYELGDATGCDYCPFRDICGFDPRIEGCGYRRLEKYSMEEAIEKMKEKTGGSGNEGEDKGEDRWE